MKEVLTTTRGVKNTDAIAETYLDSNTIVCLGEEGWGSLHKR